MKSLTHRDWAEEEFGHARLHDKRAGRRLCLLASSFSERPGSKLTKTLLTSAEREAGYRFMSNDAVDAAEIGLASSKATLGRAANEPLLYVPVDGTSLNITDTRGEKGLGLIGARNKKAHGFNVMSAVGVDGSGAPVGLLDQVYWTRTKRSERPLNDKHDRRPVAAKETQIWIDVLETVAARRDENAPGVRLWFQFDRGGDANAILGTMTDSPDWLTVRCSTDRRLESSDDDPRYLYDSIAAEEPCGHYQVKLKGTPTRTKRTARLSLRFMTARIRVNPSSDHRERYHDFQFVLALEDGTTPKGEEPVRWLLTTNRPVLTLEHALDVVRGYTYRWRCEEFHRAWKTGACEVESTQLRSAGAIERLARIAAAVAIRIVGLSYQARQRPDQPAGLLFKHIELRLLLGAATKNKWTWNPPALGDVTLKQAVEWLARLGGYIGEASGGPPGQLTLTRGIRRLEPMVEAIHMLGLTTDL